MIMAAAVVTSWQTPEQLNLTRAEEE